jgi:hypothetical protein
MSWLQAQMVGEQDEGGGRVDGTTPAEREAAVLGRSEDGPAGATTVRAGRGRRRAALETWLRRVDALLQGEPPAESGPRRG